MFRKDSNILRSFSINFFELNNKRGFSHSEQVTKIPTFLARIEEGLNGMVCFRLDFTLPNLVDRNLAFLSEGLYSSVVHVPYNSSNDL